MIAFTSTRDALEFDRAKIRIGKRGYDVRFGAPMVGNSGLVDIQRPSDARGAGVSCD